MLFGTGLVKTVEDFGSQGEWPANQQLLDWLAVEFMDRGWSVKAHPEDHGDERRLPAVLEGHTAICYRRIRKTACWRAGRASGCPEMIRDQALASSGLLVDKVGGPSGETVSACRALAGAVRMATAIRKTKGEGLYRRSLYSYWRRTVAPPAWRTSMHQPRNVRRGENRTNTPLQALNLMNDVIYLEASRKLAERMIDARGRAGAANRRVCDWFWPVPRRDGGRGVLRALDSSRASIDANHGGGNCFSEARRVARANGAGCRELAAYTAVASVIMNLDEAITKE